MSGAGFHPISDSLTRDDRPTGDVHPSPNPKALCPYIPPQKSQVRLEGKSHTRVRELLENHVFNKSYYYKYGIKKKYHRLVPSPRPDP